jgi:hypothetical protein
VLPEGAVLVSTAAGSKHPTSNDSSVSVTSLFVGPQASLLSSVRRNHCSGKDCFSLAHRLSGKQSIFWGSLANRPIAIVVPELELSVHVCECHVLGWRLIEDWRRQFCHVRHPPAFDVLVSDV